MSNWTKNSLLQNSQNPQKTSAANIDYRYNTKNSLPQHVRYKHKPKKLTVRQFACRICDRAFYTKQMLQSHEEIHANRRLHKCTLCEASFNQSASLYKHMQYKHQRQSLSHRKHYLPDCKMGEGEDNPWYIVIQLYLAAKKFIVWSKGDLFGAFKFGFLKTTQKLKSYSQKSIFPNFSGTSYGIKNRVK